jgi:hypothetical protein
MPVSIIGRNTRRTNRITTPIRHAYHAIVLYHLGIVGLSFAILKTIGRESGLAHVFLLYAPYLRSILTDTDN